MMFETALRAAATTIGILALGGVATRALRLAHGRLEGLVLALAFGRVALAGATLVLAPAGALGGLGPLLAGATVLYGILCRGTPGGWRALLRPPRPRDALAVAVPALAALALVVCAVGRQGLPDLDGDLLFRGRDTTNDPLFYAATAAQILERGARVDLPTSAWIPNQGHDLSYAYTAGLAAASGLDLLDVVFRLRPLLDVGGAALAAVALARALGASLAGAAVAGVLLALGGDLSQHAYALVHFFGGRTTQIEAWGLGQSFPLAVNPVAAALHLALAALLLLARPRGAAAAAAAGLLVAATFSLKVFLFAPVFGALALAAALRPPPGAARPLRIAATTGLLVVLPAIAVELLRAPATLGESEVRAAPCLACLPRFVVAWSFGSGPDTDLFQRGLLADLVRPDAWGAALLAMVVFFGIHLGARLFALPWLVRAARGAQGTPDGVAAVARVLLGAAALGVALASGLAQSPHPIDAGQFAWAASPAWWAPVGVVAGRWIAARRALPLAALALCALPSGLFWIVDQGALAPPFQRVSLAEQILLHDLGAASEPEDVVLEPSLRTDPARLSPVLWLAHRSVWISQEGMASLLVPAERARREALVDLVFRGGADVDAVRTALRASGVRFVYAPAGAPPAAPIGAPLRANAAGAIYRVEGAGLEETRTAR